MDYAKLRNLQLTELNLFKKFAAFCNDNDITYFALGGTLLGAVRHKGFIPWDDDMDLGIPREDYEKFIALCDNGQPDFELHTFSNDRNHKNCFAKIEDPAIKVKVHIGSAKIFSITSAWIDVFPLDGMPNNWLMRKIWKNYLLYRRALLKFSNFDREVDLNKQNRPWMEKILVKLGTTLPMEKLFDVDTELEKMDRAMRKYAYSDSDYLVNVMGAWKFKEMFHKKYYGEGKWYDFEDTKIRGPVDFDVVCTQLYGDYMVPPPEDRRNHHGSEIL